MDRTEELDGEVLIGSPTRVGQNREEVFDSILCIGSHLRSEEFCGLFCSEQLLYGLRCVS